MRNRNNIIKRITAAMLVILILTSCLGITAYALFYANVQVENNYFQTGEVKINLNGGRPIIEPHEYLFEPGMTVEKEFYIQNESTDSVYYRLFFENVEGKLADVIEVRIWNEETGSEYFSGLARDLTRANVQPAEDVLMLGEKKEMMISFHYPEESGNTTQGEKLSFDLSADAVQIKNNPNKQFE